VLVGPNGVGKSTPARNIAHQALIQGHTVRFATVGDLLGELAALDSNTALRRRLSSGLPGMTECPPQCDTTAGENVRPQCVGACGSEYVL